MEPLERRKQEEMEFHDKLRAIYEQDVDRYEHYTSNRRFYSVARQSVAYVDTWFRQHCAGKRVLDFGCGDGRYSLLTGQWAREVVGIDISPESVRICGERARERGLQDRVSFQVMDCETLEFPDSSFDVVFEMGVLHHLDVAKAYAEMARVLGPGGRALCTEAVGHNPLIQLYRRRTPHLRTQWEAEHILRARDIERAREHFGQIDMRFFHLAALGAVPFRGTRLFEPLLGVLEGVDSALLRLPGLKWWAWQVVYVLSEPRKAR